MKKSKAYRALEAMMRDEPAGSELKLALSNLLAAHHAEITDSEHRAEEQRRQAAKSRAEVDEMRAEIRRTISGWQLRLLDDDLAEDERAQIVAAIAKSEAALAQTTRLN